MKVFILANGKGTRWNNYMGIPKQFAIIDNERIIDRTIRLCKENKLNDIWIIGPFKIKGVNTLEIEKESITPKLDNHKSLWDDEFIVLYGDVYYSDNFIKDIINRPVDKWGHWVGNNRKGYGKKIVDIVWWKNKIEEYQYKVEIGEIKHINDWTPVNYISGVELENPIDLGMYTIKWNDETTDFNTPEEYLKKIKEIENGIKK